MSFGSGVCYFLPKSYVLTGSIGSTHAYGELVKPIGDGEFEKLTLKCVLTQRDADLMNRKDRAPVYHAGDLSRRWTNWGDLFEMALRTWSTFSPDTDFLVMADSQYIATNDFVVLAGPNRVADTLNRLVGIQERRVDAEQRLPIFTKKTMQAYANVTAHMKKLGREAFIKKVVTERNGLMLVELVSGCGEFGDYAIYDTMTRTLVGACAMASTALTNFGALADGVIDSVREIHRKAQVERVREVARWYRTGSSWGDIAGRLGRRHQTALNAHKRA